MSDKTPEANDWYGVLPPHWKLLKGKWIFKNSRLKRRDSDEQLSATQKYGVVPQKQFMESEEQRVMLALSGTDNFKHVDENDFVISLRSFEGGIEICHYSGCVSPAYTVLKPRVAIDESFFAYLLKSSSLIQALKAVNTGIRDGKSISYDQFGSITFPLPPRNEQAVIASVLDRKTARVDTLITKKTRFIELLKEKRESIITKAVTKGLNESVDLKDSGIAWLGRIPAHWEVSRMATIFREVARPGTPSLPILSISIHDGITDDELSAEERDRRVTQIEDRSKYKRVKPNDLAYNMMRAWQGGFGAVAVEGLVSPAYVVAEPIQRVHTGYVEQLLRTPMAIEEMRRHSRGIADFRMRLYWDYLRDLKVCLPPKPEQDAIMERIARETYRLNLLVEKTERSIELLNEHRAALINAAVTGKIDVREAA